MTSAGLLDKTTIREQLWFKVIISLFAGFIIGALLGENFAYVERELALSIGEWIALPGYIFMTLLKFVVIPLVISSVILGIYQGQNNKALSTVGLGLMYILCTSALATGLAFFLAGIIEPGSAINNSFLGALAEHDVKQLNVIEHGVIGIIKGIFPDNLFMHMNNTDMLQLVVAAMIIGFALLNMPKKDTKPLVDLMQSIQNVCMTIVLWLMKYTPIVVFGLIANTVINKGLGAITAVSLFFLNVVIGLLALLIIYMLLVTFLGKRNPFTFMKNSREVMALALATSSSSATMPVTLRVTEDIHKVSPQVSRLIIPLGTTINMDATAMYQATVVLFIAQAFGIDLSTMQLVSIVLLAIVASIGAPGIPSSSIPILAGTLASQGLPVEGIALILGVDRLLDMGRSVVNVTGDMTAATILDRFIK
ncbi:dicarboxylate/amino acid:cation symporter [Thalassotalea psychrophila]|uniref:Dicarboxylate/amino acid:cation symporter n=1 Tax=Thalassotalea psychrophila TaxID=3065647 RepID=A0ABY9TS62_9GAMM|nr:dicarboxylate/amino acid:cation symporter [Colwelliaceae bacterium SQ149]